MAIGQVVKGPAIDEEARAEVDVLNSHLEKTTQLTKKIQASLGRLETSGQSVRDVAGPLNGETRRIQTLGHNIDSILSAIDRLRQPADSKGDEEQTIRSGPDRAGLPNFLASMKRLNKSYNDMQISNLRANQRTMADLGRLIQSGNSQLEGYFDHLLRSDTPRTVEPLHYITKDKPFPVFSQDMIARLGLVCSYIVANQHGNDIESPVTRIYAEIADPSVNTAKKKNASAVYRAGTNGIGTYAQAMEGMFVSEYDNICSIFPRNNWASIFQVTCQAALTELARTLRELNSHIKAHLATDCNLAYEITEILGGLTDRLEARTGELKSSLTASLKPVRETAKSSLSELMDETRRKVNALQTLPSDGAPTPIVSESMRRLQSMVEFLQPISSIMVSLGDGGWKSGASAGGRAGDGVPSLASFDFAADGKDIFAHYCLDTVDVLLSTLEQKARILLKGKSVVGVFLANSVIIIERMIMDSDLSSLLSPRLDQLDQWRKKSTALYTDICKDLSIHLPTSGPADSASVVKGLSSKDKDKIKEKFTQFNNAFEDMVSRHKSYSMEREVRAMFGEDIRQKLQPLYERFWDRYHEIDKGKGKYVKYDKSSMAAVFLSLAS
ncbi:unnamed protein product [Clonostachys solani]|uniref:Exocyst complex protein EXO70 n=1 Tax=Clonostachys solani TaxID=160281 RepID=A0A9P0EIN9_9HYPO|nr:unnamed protein product [Clonostachys solani]